jgi:negative regulator of flagellin synthesis FlgM
MSSIGSGPGIGSGPQFEVTTPRATTHVDVAPAPTGATSDAVSGGATTAPAPKTSAAVSTSTAAGAAPVDTDRVATIKKAIQSGTYPVVPARISDAMIAAGLMLRVSK